jgi:hypothetical protein
VVAGPLRVGGADRQARARLRDEGYGIDFSSFGYDVTELMGLMPQLRETHYPIDEGGLRRPAGASGQ